MEYIIEISESKVEHLAENAEKMLRYGGKLMQCIDELRQGSYMGERDYDGYDRMGERSYGRYGNRIDYRDEEWDDDYDRIGERRGRSRTTGRYIRR